MDATYTAHSDKHPDGMFQMQNRITLVTLNDSETENDILFTWQTGFVLFLGIETISFRTSQCVIQSFIQSGMKMSKKEIYSHKICMVTSLFSMAAISIRHLKL